ncbi:MAG: hypothetical protein ACJKTH_03350 [Patescibacteria group bacterium UBA2163]
MEKETQEINKYRDPFLQRAVEHWLDLSNELGYQPLFCEWLTTRGYVLKYSIKDTSFEQGKDVVAVSPDGVAHGYQLKGGNISLKRWRSEVKPEIEALIEIPIKHPDIDATKPHVSYLVTNGEIDDSVREDIVGLNQGRWKETPLKIYTRGDLLTGFQDIAEGILPKDAVAYKRLMDLIFADGSGLPNIGEIQSFLYGLLNIENDKTPKAQRGRDIAASMLYLQMIIGPYRHRKNHGSVVRIQTAFIALMFHLVDKYQLEDKYWLNSYKIIWGDLLLVAKQLEEEINSEGFEASFVDVFDADLIPYRKHSAVSIVYPLKLAQHVNDDDAWQSMLDPSISSKYQKSVSVWSEASFVPLIFIACIFASQNQTKSGAIKVIQNCVDTIIDHNGRKNKDKKAFKPPYWDVGYSVRVMYGLESINVEDDCKQSSYMIKPLLDALIRFGEKEFVSERWREISFIRLEEFIPSDSIDVYLWRTESGESRTTLQKKEASWQELTEEATSYDGSSLPKTLQRFPDFTAFFASVFPHRATPDLVGFLFKSSLK